MKITFLVGNGFDIGLKMKTGYLDFYERYTDETDLKPEDWRLAGLAETIDDNRQDWSYYEEQLGEYAWGFEGKEPQDLLDQHADFEDKFYVHLQEQMKKLKLGKKDALTMYNGLSAVLALIRTRSKLKPEDPVFDFLCFNYSDALDRSLDNITKNCLDTREFSFNAPVHVHGRVGPQATSRCAMGVNDETQIKGLSLSKDPAVCGKLIKRKYLGSGEGTKRLIHRGEQIIQASDVIVIYGMSVGITDKNWWDKIAQWLKHDQERLLLVYIHSDNPYSQNETDRLRTAYKERLARMSPFYQSDDCERRIRFVIGQDIFAKGYK